MLNLTKKLCRNFNLETVLRRVSIQMMAVMANSMLVSSLVYFYHVPQMIKLFMKDMKINECSFTHILFSVKL